MPGFSLCSERACSCLSPKGWYRSNRARSLGFSRKFFVGPCGYCSVDLVVWGVGSNRGGGLCLPWMWMMCGVSMFPSVRLTTVVSPGRLLMRLRVRILRFARPCARGGFCDASGAEAGFLPGITRCKQGITVFSNTSYTKFHEPFQHHTYNSEHTAPPKTD